MSMRCDAGRSGAMSWEIGTTKKKIPALSSGPGTVPSQSTHLRRLRYTLRHPGQYPWTNLVRFGRKIDRRLITPVSRYKNPHLRQRFETCAAPGAPSQSKRGLQVASARALWLVACGHRECRSRGADRLVGSRGADRRVGARQNASWRNGRLIYGRLVLPSMGCRL